MSAIAIRSNPAAIPPMWERRLLSLEKRVTSSEGDGLRARWEFGRELLAQREGAKLPPGLLDAVAKRVRVSRLELQKRVQFADKFQTEEALHNAVMQWPSWHAMVRDGLPTPTEREVPNSGPGRLAMRRAARLLAEVHAADLDERDLRAMDALIAELTRIKAEQMEMGE